MPVDEQTLRCDTVALILELVRALIYIFQRHAQIDSNLLFHYATSFLSRSQVVVSATNSSI